MLISIGPRSQSEGLVDLLLECHGRIRSFVRLAKVVGDREGVPAADIVEACRRCERYFAEALPLHVEDEEMSVLPRLAGLSSEVDDALRTMGEQHGNHACYLDQMLNALRALQSEPANQLQRKRLRVAATHLKADFEEHLSLEEKIIFPAIVARLSGDEQLAIIGELRARRQSPPLARSNSDEKLSRMPPAQPRRDA